MTPNSALPDPLFLAFQLGVAGRYSIDRELGRGGMGVVYLAREVHLDRLVAIKLLPPDRAKQPELRARFLREARLAANLSHPNIIPIHAVEDANGFVFFVMAFVDGETLTHRVRTRGPLSSSEGARVLREVAWALSYAHGQGLVHRDVKPDNILLESSTGRVLVADFGIAGAVGEVSAEGMSGTPEFMSPEQVLGKVVDARSDLYALGATAYYAFSGRFPFEGSTSTEVLAKQVTASPPPLEAIGLSVPRRLAALVDRCLAKDPDHRPRSAQALADQLGVAIEQRREVPVALRVFVKRTGRMDGGGSLLTLGALTFVSFGVAPLFGGRVSLATLVVGTTAASLTYLVSAAKQLLLTGFTHADLRPAFQVEADQTREELGFSSRLAQGSFGERVLSAISKISGGVFVLSGAVIFVTPAPSIAALMNCYSVFFASTAVTAVSTIGYLARLKQHKDVELDFWSKLWNGRVGKFVFSIARKLLGNQTVQPALTHRATELSLGMAAEQLYEGLPRAMRHELRDLPRLLGRLQADAQTLRARYDDLQEAIGDAGDAASSLEYADVREMRDDVYANLTRVVSALETIRLTLLRLHAGTSTVDALTSQLGLAADVSEHVGRLIAAHEEIDRALNFPSEAEATPV